jgi:hypothetical protein
LGAQKFTNAPSFAYLGFGACYQNAKTQCSDFAVIGKKCTFAMISMRGALTLRAEIIPINLIRVMPA